MKILQNIQTLSHCKQSENMISENKFSEMAQLQYIFKTVHNFCVAYYIDFEEYSKFHIFMDNKYQDIFYHTYKIYPVFFSYNLNRFSDLCIVLTILSIIHLLTTEKL